MENWRKYLTESIDLDIEVGDVLLGGKYKNKRIVVKDIGKDELGQPTVNGDPILKVRIEKHLPDSKKSKKTLEVEKEKLNENTVEAPAKFSDEFWDEWADMMEKLYDQIAIDASKPNLGLAPGSDPRDRSDDYKKLYTNLWYRFMKKWDVTIEEVDQDIERRMEAKLRK